MRYENKFIFDDSLYYEVENKILLSPFHFTEIFYERKINNIYLDSFDFENYHANLMGNQNRIKQRIRWYGDINKASNPILEYKIKQGELGTKEYYNLPDLDLDDNLIYSNYLSRIHDSIDNFQNSYIQMYNDISERTPTLFNKYYRKYFISNDSKFRITIDRDLQYYSISQTFKMPYSFGSDYIVVELKYNNDNIEGAQDIIQNLNFRLTRNSKYVTGIKGLYHNDIEY